MPQFAPKVMSIDSMQHPVYRYQLHSSNPRVNPATRAILAETCRGSRAATKSDLIARFRKERCALDPSVRQAAH